VSLNPTLGIELTLKRKKITTKKRAIDMNRLFTKESEYSNRRKCAVSLDTKINTPVRSYSRMTKKKKKILMLITGNIVRIT